MEAFPLIYMKILDFQKLHLYLYTAAHAREHVFKDISATGMKCVQYMEKYALFWTRHLILMFHEIFSPY